MKITFLGTGTSTGIPEVGCSCEVCTGPNSKDKRLRASILVETDGKKILIDCGPDFRLQCLNNRINNIDAVLVTHEHYDHVGGLDDLRPFSRQKSLCIYAENYVADAIETRIPYVFRTHKYPGIPHLEIHRINEKPFRLENVTITPIRVMHASLPIFGYRIGNMAYLTDLKTLPEEEFSKLKGLDILIINALRKAEHISHASLEESLKIIEHLRPKKSWLIHMSHRMGFHEEVEKKLPPSVYLSYDGLVIGSAISEQPVK